LALGSFGRSLSRCPKGAHKTCFASGRAFAHLFAGDEQGSLAYSNHPGRQGFVRGGDSYTLGREVPFVLATAAHPAKIGTIQRRLAWPLPSGWCTFFSVSKPALMWRFWNLQTHETCG